MTDYHVDTGEPHSDLGDPWRKLTDADLGFTAQPLTVDDQLRTLTVDDAERVLSVDDQTRTLEMP